RVLDPVVDHLDEVPAAGRTAVHIAVLGRAAPGAAGCARDVARTRRERAQDRLEALHDIVGAAEHEAVAALETVHASTRAGVDVVQAALREHRGTANVVLEVGVPTVDDRVAGGEHAGEL